MKTNRIVVLGVAVVSGLIAMALIMSSGSETPVEQRTAAPEAPAAPQIELEGVLVAQREIPLGTIVSENDVTWVEWPRQFAGPGSIRRSEDPGAIETLKGAVARVAFFHGEPIRREKLVKGGNMGFLSALIPSGSRALAINIDSSGGTSAGGFILPNDRVDLIKTVGGSDGTESDTILTNIRVLAIGQNVEEKNGERIVTGSNATLEVTPSQAETITAAQRGGQITLALRSMLDMQTTKKANVDASDSGEKNLTVVRFGASSTASRR
jgi:pilus assembly protein CpaB